MLIKLPLAALIFAYSVFQIPYTLEIVISILLFFSSLYYYMNFVLIVGLSEARLLTDKDDLKDSFLSNLIHWTGFILIFKSDYQLFSIFLLPWLILSAITFTFTVLVYKEILSIEDKGDDDD